MIFYNLRHSSRKNVNISVPKKLMERGMILMQKSNKLLGKAIAKLAYASAKKSANSTCQYFFGQPKLPEKVKELRKF